MAHRRCDGFRLLAALALALISQGCVCLLDSEGTAGGGGGAAPCEPGCYWLLGGAPIDGCGMMGGPGCGETVDPDLEGCFQHPAGAVSGRLRVGQSSCNLLTGYGFGVPELALGPAPHESWVFSGEVIQGGLTDEEGNEIAGVAALNVQGGPQELTAIRSLAADGAETLALQRIGTLGEVQRVDLVRCTCPCEP